ncbi:MAG: hypothetical protein K2Y37_10035 [Pirellulales bacterium]|nr:hypothetical protein [Pirellulales bacterium]
MAHELRQSPARLVALASVGCWLALAGTARFVRADEPAETIPTDGAPPRKPGDGDELRRWLENMVWYHHYRVEEISAAMGMKPEEVTAAQRRFKIHPDSRPPQQADQPLVMLPYPGGRHPRLGFRDGALRPRRETKFSVFTPWDPNSYVVIDLPEAIWSQHGLIWLAHEHVPTIWTKKGVELPQLEWQRPGDHDLSLARRLPNGVEFCAHATAKSEAVRMELTFVNHSPEMLSDLRVQICVLLGYAVGFSDQTNENKLLRAPYVACRSDDGRRWIITAWEGCQRAWANAPCPCLHSDPKFDDSPPGASHRLRGWLSFYEGTEIDRELERIDATNWRDE